MAKCNSNVQVIPSISPKQAILANRRRRNRVIVRKYINTKTGAIRSLAHLFVTCWEGEEHKPTCTPTKYINVARAERSKQAMRFCSREVYIRDLTTGKIGYL